MQSGYKIRVSGHVQGVCFRDSTRRQATEHQLSGYAKNMSDGSVEILLSGDSEGIEKVMAWITAGGPPAARVDHVESEPCTLSAPVQGFTVS